MNKNGLALAADSAVTLGAKQKVYHSAEKLFRLSDTEPVAIMTYGSAQLMGVPWETIIKTYRRKVGPRRFDHLDQYAEDFLRHLESSNPLFSDTAQLDSLREHAKSYWKIEFLRNIWKEFGEDTHSWPEAAWANLSGKLKDDRVAWDRYQDLSSVGPGFGNHVLATYQPVLSELEAVLFNEVRLPTGISSGLQHAIGMMYQRDWFCSGCECGIVIAGFGEQEPFPRVVNFTMDAIVAGRLRYKKSGEGQVTRDDDAHVMPFAQRQMVDLFYSGVFPSVQEQMAEILLGVLNEEGDPAITEENTAAVATVKKFMERFMDQTREAYTSPLIEAVGALPMNELCGLAETLVSLTAFRARMSVDEAETVGGEIDVAAISKGDGFVWVQRKDLVGGRRARGRVAFLDSGC
ncbi:MAG: hypothetical protein ABI718_08055 [Acidobacteriota bacterium]